MTPVKVVKGLREKALASIRAATGWIKGKTPIDEIGFTY